MRITINTENCDIDNHYLINESADSKIVLNIEMEKIASVQSKKKIKEDVIKLIQDELKKFKWIISGSVLVDFVWYLNAVERQETDKIGDIDNISKPIQDALIGPDGILIDDAQIGGLYSSWLSRNELISDNILRIEVKFNNDDVLSKNNLKFIQYENAICMPFNLDSSDLISLFSTKLAIHSRKKIRKSARKIKVLGVNADRYLICSDWDFHKTRLNSFNRRDILTYDEFNSLCLSKGLTLKKLRELYLKPAANSKLSASRV